MKYLWMFIAGVLIGASVCALYNAQNKITETPAIAKRQDDGSLIIERKPDSKTATAHDIPRGWKAERVVRVDVQPARTDCPVCTVDLTLVRTPDQMLRVVASSQSGRVIGGVDVPIAPLNLDKGHPWAAGISYSTESKTGIWLDRDIGLMRIGIGVDKYEGEKYEARINLGFRF